MLVQQCLCYHQDSDVRDFGALDDSHADDSDEVGGKEDHERKDIR